MSLRAIVLWLIAFAVAASGCEDDIEDAGCDLFLGSAVVTGVVHDFDGRLLANAAVEFTVSGTSECPSAFRNARRVKTDENGSYELLLQEGNVVGTRCVLGRVVNSDSVSSGEVEFTSDCRRTESVVELELNLYATPSAVIPPDLEIAMYRLHGLNRGPHYRVSVDAGGLVRFEAFDNCAVEGFAEGTVGAAALARLYREFDRIGYGNVEEIFPREDCERYSTDVHYCSTSLTANGETQRVIHDHGCYGIAALDSLTRVECKIDSVLATRQWTGEWAWPCR